MEALVESSESFRIFKSIRIGFGRGGRIHIQAVQEMSIDEDCKERNWVQSKMQ